MSRGVCLGVLWIAMCPLAETLANEIATIETDRVRFSIGVANDMRMAGLQQLPAGREIIPEPYTQALFRIVLNRPGGKPVILPSHEAKKVDAKKLTDGWRLTWGGYLEGKVRVHTTIQHRKPEPGLCFTIEIDNETSWPITAVSYPVITCRLPLSADDPNEAVVFPRHEGVLLRQPHKHLTRPGMWETEKYPGHVSCQFMAYYDKHGGVYVAAEDPAGYAKEFRVRRSQTGLELTVVHNGTEGTKKHWSRPYPVVLDTFEGDWMSAADLYRTWSRRQDWCAKRSAERGVPKWLLDGAAFYNYPGGLLKKAKHQNPFFPPDKAAEELGRLRDAMDTPVVATPFSWEKHAVWIGPDYFPPKGGEQAYRDLVQTLHDRGDRLLVFLSGFRWGLAKPGTKYDGQEAFDREGQAMAVRDKAGEIVVQTPPWAKNALLCVGSRAARELLADCFRQAFDLGIDIVQLDQNVGGDVDACYATGHDHPPGPGRWQGQHMARFLEAVRTAAKQGDPDRAVSVEEPCELFIPYLDVYHGRAFTYDNWPATGRGAVSIPLFLYLYHPYIPGYAGWTGGGFDIGKRIELSIGRAFINGMLVGVRSGVWMNVATGKGSRTAFDMWKRAVKIQRRCAEGLLLGDMARPPRLRGVTKKVIDNRKQGGRKKPPIEIETVQANTWIAADGTVTYAIANIEPQRASIEIEIEAGLKDKADGVQVMRIDPIGESLLKENVKPGDWLKIDLKPYSLTCLRLD